jgi:predicted O-methyltransferase YrrM
MVKVCEMSEKLRRWFILWLHLPLHGIARSFRDGSRRLRTALGLRKRSHAEVAGLPRKHWRSVCRARDVKFIETDRADGNVNLVELTVLNALCRTHQPTMIWEIGTFDGRTTLNLALNSDAQVFTLDLPATTAAELGTVGGDVKYVQKPRAAIGARFSQPPHNALPCARRITQLYGDSATFDFAPWHGQADFVFVDGAHNYEYVVNDTRVAFRLLRPEGGIVVWHDYGKWKDVTRALNELQSNTPSLAMTHIKDTSLAIAEVNAEMLKTIHQFDKPTTSPDAMRVTDSNPKT